MKARVLVLAVNDGEEYVAAESIRTHMTQPLEGEIRWCWEETAVADARKTYDQVDAHGFVDIEIPDDVIAQVLRRQADAGVVEAEAVSEVRS